MITKNHINVALPFVSYTDRVYNVLEWMNDFHTKHLPVVNQKKFMGIIEENQLLEVDDDTLISHFEQTFIQKSVLPNEHILEAVKYTAEHHYEIVPIVDERGFYIGAIDNDTLVSQLSKMLSVNEFGGIILLEINKHQYSLAEISRIVEAENVKILSALAYNSNEPEVVQVLLKLNSDELREVINSFERFEYTVIATFKETEYTSFIKDRYDALIHYINIGS